MGHVASIVRKQRVNRKGTELQNLKIPLQSRTSSKEAPSSKCPTIFPHSATSWGLSVQACEPVGDILHSNHSMISGMTGSYGLSPRPSIVRVVWGMACNYKVKMPLKWETTCNLCVSIFLSL